MKQHKIQIGQTVGTRTVQEIIFKEERYFLQVKCVCGKIYTMRVDEFMEARECMNCRQIEYTGKKFGMLTVLGIEKEEYICKCECGKTCTKSRRYLTRAKHPQCGCKGRITKIKSDLHPSTAEERALVYVGQKINHIKVLKYLGQFPSGYPDYKYPGFRIKCDCGIKKDITHLSLANFIKLKSCGCNKFRKNSGNGEKVVDSLSVKGIRVLYKTGLYTLEQLTEMFQISLSHARNIVDGKVRKSVE